MRESENNLQYISFVVHFAEFFILFTRLDLCDLNPSSQFPGPIHTQPPMMW